MVSLRKVVKVNDGGRRGCVDNKRLKSAVGCRRRWARFRCRNGCAGRRSSSLLDVRVGLFQEPRIDTNGFICLVEGLDSNPRSV